jgi:Xaa-Pro dipeptidase
MNFTERLQAIRGDMERESLDVLVAVHDGSHFGGSSNPFMVLAGARSMGDAAALLSRDGACQAVVTPAWDAARMAHDGRLEVAGADDLAAGLKTVLARHRSARVGIAGLAQLPWKTAASVLALLPADAPRADALIERHARCKTDEEILAARKATEVAEKGYERMLELTRPGLREDELAVELRWYMKTLGGEDNFFMLNAGPHNRAVAPCSSRRLEPGDFVLTELSPIYGGQMTQICRTLFLGRATPAASRRDSGRQRPVVPWRRCAMPWMP